MKTDAARRSDRPVLAAALAVAVAVAVAARGVHQLLPESLAYPVGEVIVAVILGVVIGQLWAMPKAMRDGLHRVVRLVLPAAIVLMGARLALDELLATGVEALGMVVVLMVTALGVAHLIGRVTHAPPVLSTLLGVGVSVCGNTAIIATAPAIEARDEEVSVAIAVNTMFGMLAVLIYPLIGDAVGMSQAFFGTWAGTAVNDTSQVVAVGVAYGNEASDVATTVKLVRNTMLGVVVVVVSWLHARARGAVPGEHVSRLALLRRSFPLFVLGFLGMAVANSVGLLDAASGATGVDVVELFAKAASLLIVVALAGVGLTTSLGAARRAGWAPVAIGCGAALTTSLLSLVLILVLGPAGT